jgi:hypothetical protein
MDGERRVQNHEYFAAQFYPERARGPLAQYSSGCLESRILTPRIVLVRINLRSYPFYIQNIIRFGPSRELYHTHF